MRSVNVRIRDSRETRGQSLVEFALILPLLLLLLFGILDFGRAIAAYNSVSNAARSAARVAIVNQDPVVVEAKAVDETVGLAPIDVDFDPNVNSDDPCEIAVCMVSVRVSYIYEPVTPILGNLVGNITVSSTTEMAIEHLTAP